MIHQTALFRRWPLLVTLGVGLLVILGAISIARIPPISAQGPVIISKTASATFVRPGDTVVYTVVFTNTGALSTAASMTDTIPFGVNYVLGSVTGGATYSSVPSAQVTWSGTLNPGVPAVVTFQVRIVEPGTLGPFPITNRAQVCYDSTCVWSNAVIIYSSRNYVFYLPIVTKDFDPATIWPWSSP